MAATTDMYPDIGGRNLHVVKSGREGAPTVILEAGSGCGSELWRTVQEQAGEFAVTYSYDRAGHGLSDPGDPWSLESSLAELAPDASDRASHADAVVRALPSLDDLPLSVIAHGRADWIGDAFGLGQGDLDRAEAAWQQYQRKLPAKSSRSKFCVATAIGHLIPDDQPEVVVSEIRALTDRCSI